jgi:raffinose/stachyose/melibiose transport system permease protein
VQAAPAEGDGGLERFIGKYWPVFVLPTLAAFAVGFLAPFAMGLYLSFCDFTTISDAVFTGLDNYVRAFSDASGAFLHSLWYTGLFALLSTVVINAFGLGVALLLSRKLPGRDLYRTVVFLPNLIGGIVLGWL